MKITPDVFEAYLKCPTKRWLRSTGEPSAGATYPECVKAQNDSYRKTGTERLLAESPKDEVVFSPDMDNVKGTKWRLASGLAVQAQMDSCVLESELHAVERVPAEGRGKPTQFIPIRFLFTNKLIKDDKLLLALDAFALSKSLGREVSVGRIIHGDNHASLKVKTRREDLERFPHHPRNYRESGSYPLRQLRNDFHQTHARTLRRAAREFIRRESVAVAPQPFVSCLHTILLPCLFQWPEGRRGFYRIRVADAVSSGLESIAWRCRWNESLDEIAKGHLLIYNAQDCEALSRVAGTFYDLIDRLTAKDEHREGNSDFVRADASELRIKSQWRTFASPVTGFEAINAAAH